MLYVLLGFLTCRGLFAVICIVLKGAKLCIVENEAMTSLSSKASDRLQLAFRSKTRKAYFRTFIAFCIVTKSCIANVNVQMVLSFLECQMCALVV